MTFGWSSFALAATLQVGPAAPHATIGAALAAASPGDRIEVGPGTYDEALVVAVPVVIEGTGGSRVTHLADTVGSGPVVTVEATVLLQGLSIDAHRDEAILVSTATVDLTLVDVDLERGDRAVEFAGRTLRVIDSRIARSGLGIELAGAAQRMWIERSRFVDNDVGALDASSFAEATVLDSVFVGNHSGGNGGALRLSAGVAARVEGNTFVGNVADQWGGALFTEDVGDLLVAGNRFCANRGYMGGGAEVVGSTNHFATVHRNLFADNFGERSGGGLTIYGPMDLTNNTFVGNASPVGAHVDHEAIRRDVAARNNLFVGSAGTGAAWYADHEAADHDHSLWWGNAGGDLSGVVTVYGAHDVLGDPLFTAYSADRRCWNDDYTPLPGSPAIDAGDPAILDRDGTPSDLGWTGGP